MTLLEYFRTEITYPRTLNLDLNVAFDLILAPLTLILNDPMISVLNLSHPKSMPETKFLIPPTAFQSVSVVLPSFPGTVLQFSSLVVACRTDLPRKISTIFASCYLTLQIPIAIPVSACCPLCSFSFITLPIPPHAFMTYHIGY